MIRTCIPYRLERPYRRAFFFLSFQLVPVSPKSRKLFGSEKPFVKLRPAYFVKLGFSYVLERINIKITTKYRTSRGLRFEDTKRNMSPEMRPKSFGTFEKRVPVHYKLYLVLITLSSHKRLLARRIRSLLKVILYSRRLFLFFGFNSHPETFKSPYIKAHAEMTIRSLSIHDDKGAKNVTNSHI